jgi:alcohol dehydrogenase class IV
VKQGQCNIIIALGGGSTIDCAKNIAFSVCNEGDLFAYIMGQKTGSKALPIIAIPTTCGTGSEADRFAVVTNVENYHKRSLRTPLIVPSVSIIDPELMTTMPPHILSSVAFDALCHNMESYLNRACHPLAEIQALYGIKLFHDYFFRAYKDKEDMEAWSAISLASTLGGMSINSAGVTAPHGLEHPASGIRNITHGRGLAAVTPNIYKKSIKWAPEKFAKIACILGGKDENDCVPIIEQLLVKMELNTTLSKEGVRPEDIEWMTRNALRISMAGMIAHPRLFTKDEIREIYTECL